MMWTRLATLALCLAGGAANAQSASETTSGLESCFEAGRLADSICSKLQIAPMERVDCIKKAGAAQLKCLQQVLPEAAVGAPGRPSTTGRSAPSANIALPEPPSALSSPKEPGRTDSGAPGAAPGDGTAGPPKTLPRSEANIIPAPAGAPTAGMGQDTSSKQDERPARKKDWILSDTTSPVDFSPLVTAVIRATSDVKDGPNSFVVRCRSQHTEVSIRTDEAWSTPRGNELVVEYQINDQPMVRQPWMLSADGKTATYRNDPVELLRSVPEGATMKIAVTDKSNLRHETTFELTGLSGVRQKVGTSCNWASLNAKTSSSRR
jgi:hypothetical protein